MLQCNVAAHLKDCENTCLLDYIILFSNGCAHYQLAETLQRKLAEKNEMNNTARNKRKVRPYFVCKRTGLGNTASSCYAITHRRQVREWAPRCANAKAEIRQRRHQQARTASRAATRRVKRLRRFEGCWPQSAADGIPLSE